MAYNFILDGVQFPVAPPSMNVSINGKNETATLIDEGEINILKKAGLTEITFELLLPNKQYPFAVYTNGFQPSSYYLEHLEKIMVAKKPVGFIVNRISQGNNLLFDTNFDVSLESYTIEEDAESLGFDVKTSITLKQYRAYGTKLLKVQQPATDTSTPKVTVENSRSTAGKTTPKTYTVKAGDTLYNIAKQYLGDGSKASQLATRNNINNPNVISVGQVLQLQ